jgi:hypothetical protein
MKRHFIYLLIAITAGSNAINAQEQTYTQMFDSVFIHVSRREATGILYNRVLPFSGLYRFEVSNARQDTAMIKSNLFTIFAF